MMTWVVRREVELMTSGIRRVLQVMIVLEGHTTRDHISPDGVAGVIISSMRISR